jgi:GNAT superfamily N-acetyltransferase
MLTIRQARNYLKKHRVDQWQGDYPTEETLEADVARGECYAVTYGSRFAGFFVLSDRPEPDYDDLSDGKWRSEPEDACVLHRCAVMAEYRGSGLSGRLLGFAERLTLEKGRHAVRTDTHRHNEAMKRLLNAGGFRYCGNLFVFCEPYHDPRRQAFEKLLK